MDPFHSSCVYPNVRICRIMANPKHTRRVKRAPAHQIVGTTLTPTPNQLMAWAIITVCSLNGNLALHCLSWQNEVFCSEQTINSVKWLCSTGEKIMLRRENIWYFHQTKTIVFIILPTMKWAKFYISGSIITKVTLFGYVIYYSADFHCKALWTNLGINYVHK